MFVIVNEQTRQPVENPVERVLREGVVVGLANHTVLVARDGTERPIDDSAAPIRDAAGKMVGVVLMFRDVTEQRRAEQQRNVRLAVTHALSEAESVEDGASGVLRAVGENLGWDVGFFWTVNDAGTALVCTKSWQRSDGPVDDFEKASCNRTFDKGQGLPGRVWASGQPAWILDIAHDGNFPRLAPAVRYGLHSAFACPVVVGDRTLGVIEFFTQRIHEPDADLLEMMGTVAGSVGQFIERKAAEDELRQSEQELADFFENATVGLHWVGPDGIILRANRAELDMLGYSREEYVGRPIADFHADEDVICDILKRLQAGEKLDRVPGPPQVQGRVDQGRADRLQRAVAGRRVRPHPLLHPGRDRAEAGRSRSGSKSSGPGRSWRASPMPSAPSTGTGGSPTSTGRRKSCWAAAGTTSSARTTGRNTPTPSGRTSSATTAAPWPRT